MIIIAAHVLTESQFHSGTRLTPIINQITQINTHRILFVLSLGVDFHWYVKDSDGKWSHKPGKTAVTRRDNQGALINNPQNCDMNGYEFVCYMTTHRRDVNIR